MWRFKGSDPYGLAVYGTWKLSYDKLDGSARCLLQICSLLHHEGISEEMFEKATTSVLRLDDSELQKEVTKLLNQLGKRESGWSSWEFHRVVKCLGGYEFNQRDCTYGMHPLVQQWSRTTIGENRDVMRKCVVSIIGLSISWTFREEDYRYRRTLLKHIGNTTVFPTAPEILEASIASRLALVYLEQGYWKDAERLGLMVMEKRKQLLGDDHRDTLSSMAILAITYWKQGRRNDAERLEVVVMERSKQLLGEDHPDTLASIANLASKPGPLE